MRFMPTSITVAPSLHHLAGDQARAPDGGDQHVGARQTAARSRVREWQIVTVAFSREQQRRDRLADQVAAPDDDRLALPRAACRYARSSSITPDGVAGTSAVAALHEQAGVRRRQPVDVLRAGRSRDVDARRVDLRAAAAAAR